ncbi:MAG: restriction endonuclease subunit S [Neisseriales bacterium]|nr:MAG: restriction endonuclease subunit S [Neisseriales bacterium]
MVNNEIYNTLNFISFANFKSWDVKSFKINSQKFNFKTIELKEVLSKTEIQWVEISDSMEYPILGVRSHGQGVYINRIAKGHELTMKRYQRSKINTLFFCKVRTVGGQWGVVYPDFADSYASSNMTYLDIDFTRIIPQYLEMLLKVQRLTSEWDKNAIGADGRHFTLSTMLDLQIPLPSLAEQKQLVTEYQGKIDFANSCEKQAQELEQSIETYLYSELGLKGDDAVISRPTTKLLSFTKFSKILNSWSLKLSKNLNSNLYYVISLSENSQLLKDIYRGKSPKYSSNGDTIILNQKCNRWDDFDLSHAKNVDSAWLHSIDRKFFTKENDVLINSTGEGTIGRTSVVSKDVTNILYDSHLLLLRLNNKLINSKYFVSFMNSNLGQKQISLVKSANSTKQTELGIDNCKKVLFPLPPLDIQNKIADHITNIKNQIKELKQLAEKNRTNAILDFEKAIFHHENH